jgi:chromosomal replication initiation ATPase DnaA
MSAIYLKEATLSELLAEVTRRFDELNPVPEWAAPILFATAAYYGFYPDQLRSSTKDAAVVNARQLTIALLAQMNPSRTRAEVCAIVARGHEMYRVSIQNTDERMKRFPDFRREVQDLLTIIRETPGRPDTRHSLCRTSPQGTIDRSAAAAS